MIKYIENNFDTFFKANILIPNLIGDDSTHVYKSLPEILEQEYKLRFETEKSLTEKLEELNNSFNKKLISMKFTME